MLKKSAIAVAVSSAVFSGSVLAEAPSVDLYGRVDLGLEYYSDKDGVGGSEIFAGMESPAGNSDAKGFSFSDGNNSRLGVKGEATLPNGLKTAYQYELGTRVLDGGAAPFVRYGWLSISNGQHTLTAGTQDNYLMMYGGFNAQYSEVHGYGASYYVTELMTGSMQQTFRTDSTLAYTFGGGAFSGDAITATVALHVAEDGRTVDDGQGNDVAANDAGITGITAGVEANMNQVALTAAYQATMVSESDAAKATGDDLRAPSIASFGARYTISDMTSVGFNYMMGDKDIDNDSGRTSWTLGGSHQLTDNLNLHAGIGGGSDDNDAERQLDANIYGQLTYTLSESNQVRFEFEQVSYSSDDDAKEGDAQVFLISLRQDF